MADVLTLLCSRLTERHRKKDLPDAFEEILDNIRDKGRLYFEICREFLPKVVGTGWNQKWRVAYKRNESLQVVATVSDEAFMLLVLDNNWEEWTNQAEEEPDQDGGKKRKRVSRAKYTGEAGTCHNKGWSGSGKNRFKELRLEVEKSREDHPWWDGAFIKQYDVPDGVWS